MALVARLVAAIIVGDAPYLDPAYYEVVARRLVAGDGFSVPVLWSFLDVGSQLPADPHAADPEQPPLDAADLDRSAPISMAALRDVHARRRAPIHRARRRCWCRDRRSSAGTCGGARTVAVVSGVLALLRGTDARLRAPGRVVRPLRRRRRDRDLRVSFAIRRDDRGGPWLLLAGVMVATATLTRIDGILLGVAPLDRVAGRGAASVHGRARDRASASAGPSSASSASRARFSRRGSFGSGSCSAARSRRPAARLLWITSYNEQFSIGHPIGIASYLEWGVANIVGSKVGAFVLLVGRTTVLLGGIFVIPFVYGLIRERGRAELAPFLVTFWLVFALMVLAFTFHAPSGAYYHSAWAWLPFAIPLSVASFEPMLHSLGRRIPLFGRAAQRAVPALGIGRGRSRAVAHRVGRAA